MERIDDLERRRDEVNAPRHATTAAHARPAGLEARLAALMVRQHGAFTRAQATRAGATVGVIKRRLETGRWQRLHRDVFTLAGTPPSWMQHLSAAILAWGDGAVASHLSAAALWDLPGFPPGPLQICAPRGRKRRAVEGVVARFASHVPREDVKTVRGIPVTSVERTLIDVAAVAPRWLVEEALDDALRRRLTSIERVRRRAEALSAHGRRGVPAILRLLAARDGSASVPQSVLETRFIRALRAAGLPRPRLQYAVSLGGAGRAFLDFAYPRARVAIEVEGFRWHSGRRPWEHDRARLNALTALGWRVLRVTSNDLGARLPAVVAQIEALLASPPVLAR